MTHLRFFKISIENRALRFAHLLCLLLVVGSAVTVARAQSADWLSQVKKIYIASLGTDHGAAEIREQIVRRLRKSQDIQVVQDQKDADARLTGTGRIWVTEDRNKKVLLTELLSWVLSSGQKKCSALGYAPLPTAIARDAPESFAR